MFIMCKNWEISELQCSNNLAVSKISCFSIGYPAAIQHSSGQSSTVKIIILYHLYLLYV